ncbi:MAG TPA: hypothetical protein VJA94_24335 [Candidatus Angelobacter sp.]
MRNSVTSRVNIGEKQVTGNWQQATVQEQGIAPESLSTQITVKPQINRKGH